MTTSTHEKRKRGSKMREEIIRVVEDRYVMREEIIRVVEDRYVRGIHVQIVETRYEFGHHFVMLTNGIPGFHSVDLERVQKYMEDIIF